MTGKPTISLPGKWQQMYGSSENKDGILPLKKKGTIAVIGEFAKAEVPGRRKFPCKSDNA